MTLSPTTSFFVLWALTDTHPYGLTELFSNVADCLIAQSDLACCGIKTTARHLLVTDLNSSTKH